MSRSSVESVTCDPRLGRIFGISSSASSSPGLIRSAHTPVALTTLSAWTSTRSPDSASVKATPVARPVLLEDLRHLRAVDDHGAEALGLPQHREHEPRIVGLAVVEHVGRARLHRLEGRDQLDGLLARRSSGGGRATNTRPRRGARCAGCARARCARSPSRRTCSGRSRSPGSYAPRRARAPGTASDRRGAARAEPAAGAPGAPRGPGRDRSSAGSGGRRGPSWTSGSRCPARSRPVPPGRPSSRARRRRAPRRRR